ncbi:uncharacterized protein J3D65DRAFT_81520 [Phyllosticta citribraziliensis]|uniref:Uncharacterized protein n=1 Tax=Phyllosticta citribraziliensis TaxID=989973 RepID=A0ABR1L9Q3_9PEZI
MANTSARRLRRLHLQPFDRSGQVADKRRIRKELKDLKAATRSQRAELRETFLQDFLTRNEYKNAIAAINVYQTRRELQIDPPTPTSASLEGLPRELRQKIFEKLLEDDQLSDDRRPHELVAQRTKIALVCRKLQDDMAHIEKIWRQRMAVLSALYAPERAHFERIARSLTQVIHQTRAVDRRIQQERNRRNNVKRRQKKEKRLERGGGGLKMVPNFGKMKSKPNVLPKAEKGRDRLDDMPAWAGTRKTFDD